MPRKGLYKKTGRPVGRPKIVSSEVIQKLEQAFSFGCTDGEACLHAGISKALLYLYQKQHPDFLERKDLLKETTILKARTEVIKGLSNNPEFALRYLERKRKAEFGLRYEHTGADGTPLNETKLPDEQIKEIAELALKGLEVKAALKQKYAKK